jgi:hypothetical protein
MEQMIVLLNMVASNMAANKEMKQKLAKVNIYDAIKSLKNMHFSD